jgi:hypothetical protein
MAGYAERNGCPFRLASPSPRLIKIMRITRLDRRFLTSQASALAPGEFARRCRSGISAAAGPEANGEGIPQIDGLELG